MPTYDYECSDCGHNFEIFQNMADDALKNCPECSKESLRRLIGGGSGIIFKGTGFYVNDARKTHIKNKTTPPTESEKSHANKDGESKKSE